jgi:hypothetical protein
VAVQRMDPEGAAMRAAPDSGAAGTRETVTRGGVGERPSEH